MSESSTVRLWHVRDSVAATRYPARDGEWPEHHVKLPDWFREREGL